MLPWNPSSTHDDPPKDPTILRWFEALGPPPSGEAPPHLHAKVRARIAQHQAQWGLGAWLVHLEMPRWVPVLAASLVLSLGLNVWWGWHALVPPASHTRQGAEARREDGGAAQRLRTARFQRHIQHTQGLGTFVAAYSALREPTVIVGFTPHAARTTFVRIGTLYAEALATLSSGEVEATAQRLDGLARALASVQAPATLTRYLRALHTALQSQQSPSEGDVTALALFEPLYEDAYAGADTREQLLLFRAGTWVENMYLAAAAGDAAALRHGGPALAEVRSTFTALQVPLQILERLDRLQRLVMQQTLTAADISAIRTLVQELQAQLGI